MRNPTAVTISPDGENVYVASSLSGAVTTFDRAPGPGVPPCTRPPEYCPADPFAALP